MSGTLEHLDIETTAGPARASVDPEHPLREELHNELRARPSLYFDRDADVRHGSQGSQRLNPPLSFASLVNPTF